ncbi:MAG: 50S ribosomal protein L16 [Chlamydiales bacterium]|nr:50S ribosomal protein L16 [Chlamydiales bacterium]
MLPSRTKYRKKQRGSIKGLSKAGNFVDFGEYGMQVLERGWIKANQIEACRVAINRYFSRRGKVWIRVFPDKPITSTPAETRMGKGKGSVDHWVAAVKPGKVLFEVSGVPREVAQAALRRAAAKLALRTRFVERLEQV